MDCKFIGSAFAGSNPAPAIHRCKGDRRRPPLTASTSGWAVATAKMWVGVAELCGRPLPLGRAPALPTHPQPAARGIHSGGRSGGFHSGCRATPSSKAARSAAAKSRSTPARAPSPRAACSVAAASCTSAARTCASSARNARARREFRPRSSQAETTPFATWAFPGPPPREGGTVPRPRPGLENPRRVTGVRANGWRLPRALTPSRATTQAAAARSHPASTPDASRAIAGTPDARLPHAPAPIRPEPCPARPVTR